MKKQYRLALVCTILILTGYVIFRILVPGMEYDPEQQLKHQKVISKIPDDLSFAGDTVHFKTPDAYKKYYRELKNNTQSNSSTRLLLRNVSIYLPQIERILKQHGIPEDVKFVAVAESNLSNGVSNRGAGGFWQLRDFTAREYGLEVNEEVDQRYDLAKSTVAACKYFRQAYKQFGNWTSAAASYNRGINGLQRAMNKQSEKSYYDLSLNDETSRYIFRILAMKDMINNPQKYGVKIKRFRTPATKKVKVSTTITDLSAFAAEYNITLEKLREYNPWLLQNTLTIKKPGASYILIIPVVSSKKHKLIADKGIDSPNYLQL